MKKIISFLLVILILTTLPITFLADGEVVGDGVGTNLGYAESQDNIWYIGNDGVRVSIVNNEIKQQYKSSMDFSNVDVSQLDIRHFGYKSKLSYKNGNSLRLDGDKYSAHNPASNIPTVINNGISTFDEVKRYFSTDDTVRYIATKLGISYSKLTSGKYSLMLEPVAYFKFNGFLYAMTPTECAMYNKGLVSIGTADTETLRGKMGNLTHKAMPVAFYLNETYLGFPALSNVTANFVPDQNIINQMYGVCFVRFGEQEEEDEEESDSSPIIYDYECDTDVITSVTIWCSSKCYIGYCISVE